MDSFGRWRFAALLLVASMLAGMAQAAALKPLPRPDVRVLIDVSGSMKQNDPHNLRRPALDLLVGLFPKGARAGVWTFGQRVNVLVPDEPVTDRWRSLARSKRRMITSRALFTNIPAALEAAAKNVHPGYRTSVILLTDGMVDISKSDAKNAAARRHLLNDVLPRLRKEGIVVDTIALSNSADRQLMERLATDTGGLFAVADSASRLKRVFLQAFDAAAPAEQVPLTDNRFLVDSSIKELTALVFHQPGKPVELISPDHKHYTYAHHGDDFRWFKGDDFDLITVEKPYEGAWYVAADLKRGSRVTIVSNLSLATSRYSESLFTSGGPREMVVALEQKGKVITNPAFIKLVKFTVNVRRREDQRQWSFDLSAANPTPADGHFRTAMKMLSEPGTYDVVVTADGKTFQRRQRQTVTVRHDFDVRVTTLDGIPPNHRVTLFARNPDIDTAASKVTAHIKTADGKTVDKELAATDRNWVLTLDGGTYSGRVDVYFDIAGQYNDGKKFDYRSATVAVDQSGSQVVAPPQQAAPAAKHEKPKTAPPEHTKPKPKPEKKKAKKAAPKHAAKKHSSWERWALYAGLVAGNLLIIGLGFVAYRIIMGGGKSKVLDETDDDEDEDAKEEEKDKSAKDKKKADDGKKAKRGKADLPDDAIDIDSGDKKKK